MTLQEMLEGQLWDYGLDKQEAMLVVERVMKISQENNFEVHDQWQTEFRDIIPPNMDISSYTKEDLEKFQDDMFSALWSITKSQVRYILYARMENLAELIIKFK